MSETKAWADYSPAELLEALERTEPRYIGDLYTNLETGKVYRCFSMSLMVHNGEIACDAELLRVLVESICLWQRVAADFGNALEELEEAASDLNSIGRGGASEELGKARQALERYKYLQTGEANNAP